MVYFIQPDSECPAAVPSTSRFAERALLNAENGPHSMFKYCPLPRYDWNTLKIHHFTFQHVASHIEKVEHAFKIDGRSTFSLPYQRASAPTWPTFRTFLAIIRFIPIISFSIIDFQ
jgi:hypothetical protein